MNLEFYLSYGRANVHFLCIHNNAAHPIRNEKKERTEIKIQNSSDMYTTYVRYLVETCGFFKSDIFM